MNEKLVYAYNAVSGVTGEVPERYLDHPVLGKNLRAVRTGKPIINAPKVKEEVVEVKTEASAEADVVTKPASKKTEKEKE
jgi:hypothetical protein